MSYNIDVLKDKNGNIIRPATITDNVINPSSRKSVTTELQELTTLTSGITRSDSKTLVDNVDVGALGLKTTGISRSSENKTLVDNVNVTDLNAKVTGITRSEDGHTLIDGVDVAQKVNNLVVIDNEEV